jgi:hypothetical protein
VGWKKRGGGRGVGGMEERERERERERVCVIVHIGAAFTREKGVAMLDEQDF